MGSIFLEKGFEVLQLLIRIKASCWNDDMVERRARFADGVSETACLRLSLTVQGRCGIAAGSTALTRLTVAPLRDSSLHTGRLRSKEICFFCIWSGCSLPGWVPAITCSAGSGAETRTKFGSFASPGINWEGYTVGFISNAYCLARE